MKTDPGIQPGDSSTSAYWDKRTLMGDPVFAVYGSSQHSLLSRVALIKHHWTLRRRLSQIALHCGRQAFLDAGCGVGFSLDIAARFFDSCVGVDFSLGMLTLAKQRYVAAQLVRASVVQLPFANDSFDIIHCRSMLENLTACEEIEATIAEFVRCLRPHGGLIVTLYPEEIRRRMRNGGLGSERAHDVLREMLTKQGLEYSVISGSLYFPTVWGDRVAQWPKPMNIIGQLALYGLDVLTFTPWRVRGRLLTFVCRKKSEDAKAKSGKAREKHH